MTTQRPRSMPSKERIREYWGERLELLFKVSQFHSLHDLCFACEIEIQTERCHILAVSAGGDDSVENMHLLCPNCHVDSEKFSGAAYWAWYNATRSVADEFDTARFERNHEFQKRASKIASMIADHTGVELDPRLDYISMVLNSGIPDWIIVRELNQATPVGLKYLPDSTEPN